MFHIRIAFIILCGVLAAFATGCGSSGTVIYSDGAKAEGSETFFAEDADDTESSDNSDDTESSDNGQYAVYVCGAVLTPGVYYLPCGSIKQDAVLAAGGFAKGASEDYVNLAEELAGGEKIYIPFEDELEDSEEYSDDMDGEASDGRININTAGKEELMTLTGIGEGKAQAIITYREENGGFSAAEDIMKVPGIKEATFENIKDCIVVD